MIVRRPSASARHAKVARPASGSEWVHEIKHDGYRLMVRRDRDRVRCFTKNGHDWTDCFPRMVEASLRNRNSSFVLDGEAVLLDTTGISDFNALHSRKRDAEVQLYAFDCLGADGDDLRRLPLSLRKTNLARILARRIDGIHIAPFEQGEIGPHLFRHACKLGLERLVSKHRDSTYPAPGSIVGSRSRKQHPAVRRVMDAIGQLSRRGNRDHADRCLPVDGAGCGTRMKPKPGDCCVFCPYGNVPCPPIQEHRKGACYS
jgi:bifunctional non-homologous end joining protein LigD